MKRQHSAGSAGGAYVVPHYNDVVSYDSSRGSRPTMATLAQKQPADPEVGTEINYGPLPELIGYRLKRAYAYSIQSWDALFADLGLPYGHYSILLLISLNPGLSQLRVAEAAGLDGSPVEPTPNRFFRLGW